MKNKSVSIGIAPDDLQVGDYVAIVDIAMKRKPKMVMGRDADGDPMLVQMPTESGDIAPGVPHKVLGISWPWAVFGVLMPGGTEDGPVIRDLRNIRCMRLEDQYVEAIKLFEKPVSIEFTNELSEKSSENEVSQMHES